MCELEYFFNALGVNKDLFLSSELKNWCISVFSVRELQLKFVFTNGFPITVTIIIRSTQLPLVKFFNSEPSSYTKPCCLLWRIF